MSLNSLASHRVARELPLPRRLAAPAIASEDKLGPKETDVQNALSALVEYVPSETVTMYLAAIASVPALAKVPLLVSITGGKVYACFAVATPVLLLLIYAGKRRAAGLAPILSFRIVPWWPMIAATIAFLAWGITVPGAPFLTDENRVVGALLAILVSTLLGVAGRLFGPKPTTDQEKRAGDSGGATPGKQAQSG